MLGKTLLYPLVFVVGAVAGWIAQSELSNVAIAGAFSDGALPENPPALAPVEVPRAWGRAIGVAAHGQNGIVWFEAEDGTIRTARTLLRQSLVRK